MDMSLDRLARHRRLRGGPGREEVKAEDGKFECVPAVVASRQRLLLSAPQEQRVQD